MGRGRAVVGPRLAPASWLQARAVREKQKAGRRRERKEKKGREKRKGEK
jgi:hypothetical protein